MKSLFAGVAAGVLALSSSVAAEDKQLEFYVSVGMVPGPAATGNPDCTSKKISVDAPAGFFDTSFSNQRGDAAVAEAVAIIESYYPKLMELCAGIDPQQAVPGRHVPTYRWNRSDDPPPLGEQSWLHVVDLGG